MLNWKTILKALLILLLQVSLVEYAFGSHLEVEGASSTYKSRKSVEEFRKTEAPIVLTSASLLSLQFVYHEAESETISLDVVAINPLVTVSVYAERSPPLSPFFI